MLIYYIAMALSFLILGMMLTSHYKITNLEAELDKLQEEFELLKKKVYESKQ